MKRYVPREIESKWQLYWDENQTYVANLQSDKKKYIAMSMFNYPSGAGIHIGHAMNYTISDVMARFKRQQGYESYHPVGWDSFGMPAENYAIKAGVSPQESMAKIIPSYHKQYKAMGWSNDWTKEIATHEPEYYKWTQWIFSEMYRDGLAYQDARMQWWCDSCQTVLANEQVIDDKCWRHDSADDPVVAKREVKQWFFKITDFADELLEATPDLDWTDSVKLAQINWIGKSKGAEIDFHIDGTEEKITVFTTRPDTISGATFLVIAPEHETISRLGLSNNPEIATYIQESTKKTEIERQASKDKTGVETGVFAINPINGEKIPVWIADYVLIGYGTGAIMAVPAHDERDNEFAQIHNLKTLQVIDVGDGELSDEGILINSGEYNGLSSSDAREKIVADLEKKALATEKTNYKLRDWSVTRQRYWGAPVPIIHCEKCGPVLVPDSDLPVVLPVLTDFAPIGDGRSALARATEWLHTTCPECGGPGERETDTLDTYIDSSWYMLRYFDPKNSESAFDTKTVNAWMPIDFYNGADHATAHMIYARFITRFFQKKGFLNSAEPFKKFLFNGKVTASDGTMFSKSKGNGVDPLEIINEGYGADALRTYLMFAAPLDIWMRWDSQGVPGTYRFLSRVWTLTQEFLESEKSDEETESVLRIVHPAIKKVTHDLEHQKYNTAIAAMMKTTNDLYIEKQSNGIRQNSSWRFALESLVMLVAPFAPHMSEELWQDLGHEDSIHRDHWPEWEDAFLAGDEVTIAVQINGKVRATITISVDADERTVLDIAYAQPQVQTYISSQTPKKVIYVPGRILNIVL